MNLRGDYRIDEIRAVLARHRIEASVSDFATAGPPDADILLEHIATIIIKGGIQKFLDVFASEAAKDAYKRASEFLSDLRKVRNEVVQVWDSERRISVRLSQDVSEQALRAFYELDLSRFANDGSTLTWFPEAHQWRPVMGRRPRKDISGWYAEGTVANDQTSWHATRDASTPTVLTICDELLDGPQTSSTARPGFFCRECVLYADMPEETKRRLQAEQRARDRAR